MDPLAAATTLATIVGLLGDFAAHRKANEPSDLPEFIQWLRTHGHDQVIAAIEANHATSISIKAILVSQGRELREMLIGVDTKLAALLEGHGALGGLAITLRPDAMLSEQAKNILISFEEFQAVKANEMTLRGLPFLSFSGGTGGTVIPTDQRFFRDDLGKLLELQLLRRESGRQGPIYCLTRSGSELAKSLIQARA